LLGVLSLATLLAGWRFHAALFANQERSAAGGSAANSGSPKLPSREPSQAARTDFQKVVLPFLSQHCFTCHGNGKKKGGVSLDCFPDDESVQKDGKTWETVIHMIRTGEMPPKKQPRPAANEIEQALRTIEATLAKADCIGPRRVGRVTIRRLNRVEYNNTIHDLVGIDFKPAADFPADDVGYGFDNIGDVLSLSPLLLEKYLAAAEAIVEQAIVIVDPIKPTKRKLGGLQFFPERAGKRQGRGNYVLSSSGQVGVSNYFDGGDYVIRVQAFSRQVDKEPVRMALRVNRDTLKEFDVKAGEDAPATFEIRTTLKTGTTRLAVSFLNPGDSNPGDKDAKRRELVVRFINVDGPYNAPPPKLPAQHQHLMAHKPGASKREAAREILTRFATGAFRRPVQTAEVERFLKLYDLSEKEGLRWEKGIRLAMQGILVSPHFLFRIELDPPRAKPGTAYPISDYELASRLSYFLWSTMPDDELFRLAGQGKLRQNLDSQVARMLQDPKSSAFVQNFAGQWLTLRNLPSLAPDAKLFPTFDEDLRAAMGRETELFFEAILREDRSILDFLDADFTFVNERLAKHYGIPGIHGKDFQRVKVPAGRGGVLTQASILTLTSNPTRTSPVKRGKWVLEQILGTPPPPPPPDAGELKEDEKAQLTGSLRQRMEQHRAKASCAGCHNRMDPLGFAFENFDAIGAWRMRDGPFTIDPSGVLPDGQSFKGPTELRTILRGKKDLFARCLTEKILTYALGRGLEYYDRCAVDQIVGALASHDHRFSSLIGEVVKSEPFQMRTVKGDQP
jgi:mono/diheme cytochrome c family protein